MQYLRRPRWDECYRLDGEGHKPRTINYQVPEESQLLHHCDCTARQGRSPCNVCGTVRCMADYIPTGPGEVHRIHWESVRKKLDDSQYTNDICIYCINNLTKRFKEIYKTTELRAFFIVCGMANLYYDADVALQCYNDTECYYDDGVKMDPDIPWTERYFRMKLKDPNYGNLNFWESDCVTASAWVPKTKVSANEGTKGMSDEDRDNYNQIWATYHYDPFEDESPKDRSRLMSDLVTMIDDAMKDDLVRMRAALEIVRAFYRIDKIGETLKQLQLTPEDTVNNSNAIKQLTAAKSQETSMVTNFSKDHGFAEKYAISKSKGSGTLSAIVRDMKEANYDFGTVNAYDIETSEAIKQVSDISAESIFKQVGFTSADYADMVKEQAIELKKLREELARKEEELRLIREKNLKQELLEELRIELKQKGIPDENIEEIISKEYDFNRPTPLL